jgi:hypothetical protein
MRILRILLLVVGSCLLAHAQGMGPGPGVKSYSGGGGSCCTFVNAVSGENNSASVTTASTSSFNATSGNIIVVIITYSFSNTANITMSDTAGNTYTQVDVLYHSTATFKTHTYYAKNITGNASNVVTATSDVNVGFLRMACVQYSGASTSSPLDQHNITSGSEGFVGSLTSVSYTTSTAKEVLIGLSYNGGGNSWVPDTGYTTEVTTGSSSVSIEDQIVTSIQTGVTTTYGGGGAAYRILAVITLQ